MSTVRFWRTPRWREIFSIDGDLTEAEGLAAGTGLLTGDTAGGARVRDLPCPRCEQVDEVAVESVDLVRAAVVRRCAACGLAWTSVEASPRRSR